LVFVFNIFLDNLFCRRKLEMLFRKLRLVFMLALFGMGLLACGGDSDSESSATPKPMASDGVVEAYDPDVPSMMVEDNGVVSEEEIYKNWPAEDAVVSGDAVTTTDQTSETSAPAAVGSKTHTVIGQATSFSPNILFINPGDTVQWQNMTIHDSVSMEGLIPEGAEPWVFKLGQNGAVTLTEEGVYIYKCNPHYPLGMVAAIIVGKPVNIEQVQTNATGRSKGIVIKVVKALASQ
jgi:pseudoazurin